MEWVWQTTTKFIMIVKIADKCGAKYVTTARKEWSAQQLHDSKFTSLIPTQKKEVTKDAKEWYLTIIFILNASKRNFSKYRDDCGNSYLTYTQNLYPNTLEAAREALDKFKYDPTVYNQQSTSTSASSSRASSSDTYFTHHTFIQNEGPNSIEKATSTSDEEEDDDTSYVQSSKEIERDDTTKLNTTANSGSSKITCYRCRRDGYITPKYIYSTKLNEDQIMRLSSTEAAQLRGITDGMIDNWNNQVDEEGYHCIFFPYQQKLASIANKPQPNKKENKGSTLND